jgi:hypothetical protein
VEAWVCNDLNEIPEGIELSYQLERGGQAIRSARVPARIRNNEAVFQGRIRFELPAVTQRETVTLRLGLLSASGETLHDTTQALGVFPVLAQPSSQNSPQALGGEKARQLASELALNPADAAALWIIDDPIALENPALLDAVAAGATALVIELPPGEYPIAGSNIVCEEAEMGARHFVARATEHPLAKQFREDDFKFWFDPALDRAAPLLETLFFADDSWSPILRTGQGGWGRAWEPALAAAVKPFGKGRFVICQVTLAGRLVNPVARLFAQRLVQGAAL